MNGVDVTDISRNFTSDKWDTKLGCFVPVNAIHMLHSVTSSLVDVTAVAVTIEVGVAVVATCGYQFQ